MRALAAPQGGVITASQCRALLGADASALRRLLGAGAWSRARRGVYRDPLFHPHTAERAEDHHTRCAALLAGLGGGAVVSHLSAARLLDLPLPPSFPEDVVITRRPPAPANRLGPRTRVHVARFHERDVLDLAGVPVLAGARLVVDCCAAMPPDSALALADAALRRGLTTYEDLHVELRRRRGRPGARLTARVVERADGLAESWFESMSRWWLLEAGLPRPELQVRFFGQEYTRARVDMYWAEYRTVGEADGAGKYDEPGALFAEKQREDWLRDAHRVEVVRWVPREMRSAGGRAGVADRLHRAFARGAR